MTTIPAVILASGGLDSTVMAAMAKAKGFDLHLLTIDYGQRHQYEIECAKSIATWLGVHDHKILQLDLRVFGGSALTDEIPVPTDRLSREREHGIPVTYVPARNTIFLSLALAYAEVLNAPKIFFGAKEDGVAIRILFIDKIEPEVQTVLDKRYPIQRPVMFITSQQPTTEVLAFEQFVLSQDGQRLIRKSKYYPLTDH